MPGLAAAVDCFAELLLLLTGRLSLYSHSATKPDISSNSLGEAPAGAEVKTSIASTHLPAATSDRPRLAVAGSAGSADASSDVCNAFTALMAVQGIKSARSEGTSHTGSAGHIHAHG